MYCINKMVEKKIVKNVRSALKVIGLLLAVVGINRVEG